MNRIYVDQAQAFEIICRRNNDFTLTVSINAPDLILSDYVFRFEVTDKNTKQNVFTISNLPRTGNEITIFRGFADMNLEDQGYLYELIGQSTTSQLTFLSSKFRVRDGVSNNEAVTLSYNINYGTYAPRYITGAAVVDGELIITLSNGSIINAGNVKDYNGRLYGKWETQVANGLTKTFQILHGYNIAGLAAEPEYASVVGVNENSQPGNFTFTKDSLYINITYKLFPLGSCVWAWTTTRDITS